MPPYFFLFQYKNIIPIISLKFFKFLKNISKREKRRYTEHHVPTFCVLFILGVMPFFL